jgi:hypothetical protein
MPRDIPDYLAPAGRVTDMDRILQVEMTGEGGEVVGVMIHIVPFGALAGPAVAAAVMGNDAVAPTQEEDHLRVPVVRREGPSVGEDDGLAGAPVLVEDRGAVGGGNCRHRGILS